MFSRRTFLAATAACIALPAPARSSPFVAWRARDLTSGEPGTLVGLVAPAGLALAAGAVLAQRSSPDLAWERCDWSEAMRSHLLLSTHPLPMGGRRSAYGCFGDDATVIAADLANALLFQNYIAVDYEDVATVLTPQRVATAASVRATGADRTEAAVRKALAGVDIRREQFLLSLAFPPGDVKLAGCKRAVNALRGGVYPDAMVMYAVACDPGLAPGSMRATVIAS